MSDQSDLKATISGIFNQLQKDIDSPQDVTLANNQFNSVLNKLNQILTVLANNSLTDSDTDIRAAYLGSISGIWIYDASVAAGSYSIVTADSVSGLPAGVTNCLLVVERSDATIGETIFTCYPYAYNDTRTLKAYYNSVDGLSAWLETEDISKKGAANGYAGLDGDGLVPVNQLPPISISNTFPVASQVAMLALTAETGDIAIRSDLPATFILRGADASVLGDWEELPIPTDLVASVAGYAGIVTTAQILTALKTIDGTGSGLDADLLDGVHLSSIAKKTDYATSTVGGTLKARLQGTVLYLTNNGNNA